ncbi:Iron-sulfur assembly protein 1 [Thelotrema lepadinum]|nr:Iron-sulfur assembly protein 1 [Thelotrema lepadinum]
MSVQRSIVPIATSTSTFLKFAGPTPRLCLCATRHFTSSLGGRLPTKRKLVTATAYRPHSFDPALPPRNSNSPDTSISGAVPRIHDIRPPQIEVQEETVNASEIPSISISEREAQKSKPIETLQQEGFTTPAKPKRPKLRPRKAAMTLTESAISHLRLLLEQPDPKLIRVGVKNRGCSGLAYHLEYVEKPGNFDETVEQDGVRVLIDSKALFSIIGSEMDWVEDKLNQRFVFRNPNIKEQCGCGESFMV